MTMPKPTVVMEVMEILQVALEEIHDLAEDNDMTDDDMHELLVTHYDERLPFYYRQQDFE